MHQRLYGRYATIELLARQWLLFWFDRWRPSLSSIRVLVWPCSITTATCRSCRRRSSWTSIQTWLAAITTGSAASHETSVFSCFARRLTTTSRSSSSRDFNRPSKPWWPNSTYPQSWAHAEINLRRNLFYDHSRLTYYLRHFWRGTIFHRRLFICL